MKDSKEYSKKVHKLYRSLKRRYTGIKKTVYDEPVEALVYATISEKLSEKAAQSAIKRFANYFIDFNDLRVSRTEEIIEALGTDTPATRNIASALGLALRSVFSKYNSVSLMGLHKMSKRPARQALEKIDGASRFAVDYCMLTSLHSHAIPLTKKMIEYLRNNELVHPEADEEEIEGFLARQISAENAYKFYALLRRQSELPRRKMKKKTARKTKAKTASKTKKKTKKRKSKK
jgi:endonuclease III